MARPHSRWPGIPACSLSQPAGAGHRCKEPTIPPQRSRLSTAACRPCCSHRHPQLSGQPLYPCLCALVCVFVSCYPTSARKWSRQTERRQQRRREWQRGIYSSRVPLRGCWRGQERFHMAQDFKHVGFPRHCRRHLCPDRQKGRRTTEIPPSQPGRGQPRDAVLWTSEPP